MVFQVSVERNYKEILEQSADDKGLCFCRWIKLQTSFLLFHMRHCYFS